MKKRVPREFLRTAIQPSANLSSLSPYVSWRLGSHTITLDGKFTFEELRLLADHMARFPITEPWDEDEDDIPVS